MPTQINIYDLSFNFALKSLKLCRKLYTNKHFEISSQLLRCSTSIGANVSEAGAAPTKKDFANKMSIASKEARETEYWLRLIGASRMIEDDLTEYLSDIRSIVNILTRIVKTSRENEAIKYSGKKEV